MSGKVHTCMTKRYHLTYIVFGVTAYNTPMKSGLVQQLLPYAQQAGNSNF